MADQENSVAELMQEGLSLFYREQHREAAAEFQRALRLDPDNAELHYYLGNAYYYQNRIDEAMQEYCEAVALDPDEGHYHYVLGNTYLEQNRYEEAIAELEKSIASDDSQAHAFHNLGEAFYLMGRYKESAEAFRQALDIDPNQADTYLGLYISLRRDGRDDEGREIIQKAEKFVAKDDSLHHVIKFYLGHLDGDELLKKVGDKINKCKFNYHLGMYHIFQGNLKDARESLGRCRNTNLTFYPEYRRALRELENIKN